MRLGSGRDEFPAANADQIHLGLVAGARINMRRLNIFPGLSCIPYGCGFISLKKREAIRTIWMVQRPGLLTL